jgi:hypothetical protein
LPTLHLHLVYLIGTCCNHWINTIETALSTDRRQAPQG